MLFNSLIYLLLFLPLAVLFFHLFKHRSSRTAKIWLISCSLFFYGWWKPPYLVLFLTSIILNYLTSLYILKSDSRFARKVAVTWITVFNVGLIAYYKYADFLILNFNYLFDTNYSLLNIFLPLAISFFTFQQIAYIVDCYRSRVDNPCLVDYLLFISFFPQLIAGPIVQYKEIIPQLRDHAFAARINWEKFSAGLILLAFGLGKKVLLADFFAIWANYGFDEAQSLSFLQAWITSLSYTFQLYFDFSGYTDMALSSALLVGISLPQNFNSPYKSLTIQDFWRRWHITLGRFLREYLYIPLGGSRKGGLITAINVTLVFFIAGLWHGAGWTFIIWGLMHGAGLVLNRVWQNMHFKMPNPVAWIITFLFVNFAWVLFRAESLTQANLILAEMFKFDLYINQAFYIPAAFIALGFFITLLMPNSNDYVAKQYHSKPIPVAIAAGVAFCGLLAIKIWNANEFLYFQF